MRIRILALTGLMLALSACQRDEPPATAEAKSTAPACVLRVGWDPWEPYQFEAADGAMSGLDVEIVQLLASDAGCTVGFERGSWQALLGRLRDGDIHVLMAATATDDRRAYAHFSAPYRRESFALFTRSGDVEALGGLGLRELAESGRRIALTEGYYYGAAATQVIHDEVLASAFVPAPVVELNYTRLLDGEVDALLDDPFVAAAVLRRKGLGDRIARHPLEIHSGEVSLMLSRAGVPADVIGRIESALAARLEDGSLTQLIDKYQD